MFVHLLLSRSWSPKYVWRSPSFYPAGSPWRWSSASNLNASSLCRSWCICSIYHFPSTIKLQTLPCCLPCSYVVGCVASSFPVRLTPVEIRFQAFNADVTIVQAISKGEDWPDTVHVFSCCLQFATNRLRTRNHRRHGSMGQWKTSIWCLVTSQNLVCRESKRVVLYTPRSLFPC